MALNLKNGLISSIFVLPFIVLAACSSTEDTTIVPPPTVPQTSLNFTASGITVDPVMVLLGQTTKVSVTATSSSDKSENGTVFLNVDGRDVKSQQVSLEPGESRNVTFYYYSTVAGNHTIRVGGSTCVLMVHVTDPNAEMNHTGMPGM